MYRKTFIIMNSGAAEDNVDIPNFDTKEHVQTLLLFFFARILKDKYLGLMNTRYGHVCACAVARMYAYLREHADACARMCVNACVVHTSSHPFQYLSPLSMCSCVGTGVHAWVNSFTKMYAFGYTPM